jgi:hypothetical protein
MNMLIYQWYEIVWWIIPMFAKPIREFCGDILPQLKGKQQNIHVILVICWWNIRHSPQKTTSRTRCSATEETEPEACDYCAQSFTKCHGNMLSIVGAWECIPVSKWFVSHEYSSYIVIFPHYSWHILRLLLVSGARTSNWSKSLSRSLLIILSPRLWVQSPCPVFKSKFSHLFIPLGGSSRAKENGEEVPDSWVVN